MLGLCEQQKVHKTAFLREIKCLIRRIFYSSYLRIVDPSQFESGSLGCLNQQYEVGA
jgi:hypothetical protein